MVDCISDRPSESVLFKSITKIGYGPIEGWVRAYADELTLRLKQGDYTQVIYIGGMSFCFTHAQLELMRAATSAEFVAFLWDSLANCPRIADALDLFDRVLSFEPSDCNNSAITLRPLFFGDEYRSIPLVPEDGFKYDACFIGSAHQPSKFKIVKDICQFLKEAGYRVFEYFYMPSQSVELLRKAEHDFYRGVTFQHMPLGSREVAGIYAQSKAIIDSPQSSQIGLTMRTIEAVGSRRKLITANKDVLNYDFASAGRVFVWDGQNKVAPTFFSEPYQELSAPIYESYSIGLFVDALTGKADPYSGYSVESSEAS